MEFDAEQVLAQAEQAAVEQGDVVGSWVSIISFEWGEETYGLPLTDVREVAKVAPITLLPGLPPTIIGAMNLRGEIFPVVDLRSLLNLSSDRPSALSRLIIVAHDDERIGILVDAIGDIFEVPTFDRLTRTSDLILGQATLPDGHFLNLLDLQRALATLFTV